ncbi:hypothetical protein LshimejAT787_0212320 [Lyophyllum shimeji]|uniref:Uncharacterized protein n=1 Tax=Lyophyllum shimeji TaxID=47721 RepID=A0A9P3UJQ5_LYOSH|nr:hypothetical protein LshimejAT787_0212320 [Lyophyllum shimeji]
MTRNYASTSRTKSTTKTLYTPVFYATSQSSGSGSTPPTEVPEAYLERLSRKHIALAQIVQEVPSSRFGSPVEGTDDSEYTAYRARVDALQRRVKEAFKYADGDPADGKWSSVVQLLKLNTTRRRRWLETTTAGRRAESSSGWINALSEREWEEWEEKWKQEMHVKQKVQSWQEKVEQDLAAEPTPVVSKPQDPGDRRAISGKKQSTLSEVVKVKRTTTLQNASTPPTTLGFPVVKRSNRNLVGKPKFSGKQLPDEAVAGPSSIVPESNMGAVRDPAPPIDSSSARSEPRGQIIEDISETSFLPPSFPSHLQTSTPNARRHKPEPIALVPPSSPLSGPPSIRVYGRQQPGTSSSLPGPPSTPTRNPKPDSTSDRAQVREKRPRSVTPQHAIKKARTSSGLASSSSDGLAPPSTPPPHPLPQGAPVTVFVTPQRAQQLPTLNELLASSKKIKSPPRSKAKKATSRPNSTTVPPPPPPPQAKVPEQEPEPVPQPVREPTPAPAPHAPKTHDSQLSGPDAADPSIFERFSYRMGIEPGMAPEYDYDMASPTKSLCSLAADSDEEPEMDLDLAGGGFNPPFTSTQAGADQGLGWMGYNSQFDVDGKVDMVSKFIERDVNVDYEGWLRDPSAEAEPVDSQ